MAAAMKHRNQQKKDAAKHEKAHKEKHRHEHQKYEMLWTPKGYTAFKILLSARICAAVWNIVGDCDETYNYWEPMHFLMFGKGFQTWEYSPVYAIRSYAYLWIHALPLSLYNSLFSTNKVMLFYLLRCLLALVSSLCEVYFYKGVCKQFGANTGRICLAVMLMGAGMFISSSAFLPSSFCMYMTLLSMGGWYQGHLHVAVLSTAASSILGWPFAGIIGLPIALDVLIRRKAIAYFIQWCLISLVLFLFPSMQIDYQYYGKLVIAPLNIITYNVFTDHGPNLYGVEPFSFYFFNGFLNFNFIFILALLSCPLVIVANLVLKLKQKDIPDWLLMLPMYLWMLIFFTRPHKEERFLFPIYPLIALFGAVSIDYLQKLFCYLLPGKSAQHYTDNTNWIPFCMCCVYTLLSVSRIVAVYQGYHAPLDIYVELNKIAADPKIHTLSPDKPVNLCVGKEWYRFPSNFFLPNNWNLQFLKSEFKGQLPKPYSSGQDATKIIPTHMNDMNKEETSRYINITRCHYLIDLDLQQESVEEPNYSSQTEDWRILHSVTFLDASRMNDIDMITPGMSEMLYVALCHIVGFPTQVRIRREMLDLGDRIDALKSMKTITSVSGSCREGFRLSGSDVDTMHWPKDHKVIWDYNQCDFYRLSGTSLIMMKCCDMRPGFALLQLLTPSNNRYVISACTRMNDELYISSSLYREKTLSLSSLKSTIHGPCASGYLGDMEYDDAFCLSCDFWPPLATSFIERSQIRGWPPSRVLRDIVDHGCHFVPIGRRNSPQQHNEWRISFSVAEQRLVYSMNHCQFLCYGMLKIFLKEVLNSYSEEHLICSYFLKTVVFWEIQGQEIHKWTPQNILSCIWQCVKHLIKLVNREECPNFFVPSNNMFYGKIVGAARLRLLSQLEDLYSTGVSCLLHCPSILRIIEKLGKRYSTHRINVNENFWLSTADCDLQLFNEAGGNRGGYKNSIMKCYNTLSILQTIKQTPLSEYQSLALQICISDTLVCTAVHLHDMCKRPCYRNRGQYCVDRKVRHMLYYAAKSGNITDLLYIALYYYMTYRYKRTLHYVEITKCKLSKPYVMRQGKVNKTRYNEAVEGMSPSTRMKKAYASVVLLYSECLYIRELTLEMKAEERKTEVGMLLIPPHVIVSMLSVLCHRGNRQKQEEAIYDLQTLLTHDDGKHIVPNMRSISWQILGLSQEIYGDMRAALTSYQEALKYTELQLNEIEEATKARIQHVQCTLKANSLYQ